jgi:hypothetical protein
MAGGNTTIGCGNYPGSVRAFDPGTGDVLWEHGSPGIVVAAIASANGLIVDGAGRFVEVLDASTGSRLFSYQTGNNVWGAPVVSNGAIFVGSNDTNVYAFAVGTVTQTPTPAPTATSACTATPTSTNTPTPTDTPTPSNTPTPSPTYDPTADSDGDGCSDVEEAGSVPMWGGMRDMLNEWDFYDVNATHKVDAVDIALVRSNFNVGGPIPPEDEIYDRSDGLYQWAPGPPDGSIGAQDIGLVRTSFNHNCQAPP